jgi:hypothetical protein
MMTISDRNAHLFVDVLDYDVDDDATAGINLAGFPILGLLVPVLNDTPTITVEITTDGGTTWLSLLKADGTTAAVSITGGATAFYVSSDVLSPLAAYAAHLRDVTNDVQVRLKTSAAQTADRTFTWIGLA